MRFNSALINHVKGIKFSITDHSGKVYSDDSHTMLPLIRQ